MDSTKPKETQVILPFVKHEPTPAVEPPSFNVLVADGQIPRANMFRFLGRAKPFEIKFAYSLPRLIDVFTSPPKGGYDLVYTSAYLGEYNQHQDLAHRFAAAYKAGLLKCVILNTPIGHVAEEFFAILRQAKVPSAWFPFDSERPNNHVRREVPVCQGPPQRTL